MIHSYMDLAMGEIRVLFGKLDPVLKLSIKRVVISSRWANLARVTISDLLTWHCGAVIKAKP